MANFNGQLRSNENFAGLFNMIISITTYTNNIYDTKSSLIDLARVDGGLYGDTKLYLDTDVLETYPWGVYTDANGVTRQGNQFKANNNLLEVAPPKDPDVQSIVLDQFRQIQLTVGEYTSKRAFSTEGAYSQFASVILGWIRDTKRIYDATLYNTFIGTDETSIGRQQIVIPLQAEAENETNVETEARHRLDAQTIAMYMSNLMVDLEDVSRDFTDNGNLKSFNSGDLIAVWNSEVVNKINKLDLPMIYNELKIDKKGEFTLPARYFGKINTTAGTAPASNSSIRSLYEATYTVGSDDSAVSTHVFPGDLIPGGAAYAANETYTQDATIAFKIMHKESVPYMSAFEVGTSFFNEKSLATNHYLTWGYNTLEHLKGYPMITVRLKPATAS